MKAEADGGGAAGPGKLYVRSSPPEAWEGGWEGETDKSRVARSWPCAIVCENLVERCLELGSTDNLSAVLVLLSDDVGVGGNDGSGIDHVEQGHGIERSAREAEAWHRRRNS